jgi:hypothetical protein
VGDKLLNTTFPGTLYGNGLYNSKTIILNIEIYLLSVEGIHFWFVLNSALRLLSTRATITIMAVVAAMMSTITTATTAPLMATVLSEDELAAGSEGDAAV